MSTGDLSVIGPLPVTIGETYEFGNARDEFLSSKPEITGWWQVAERNNATWENGNRQMLELFYVRHTSLALDSRIFVIAFKAMGGGGGQDRFKPRRRHRRRRPQAPWHARGCGLTARPRRRGVQPGGCSGFQSDDEGESISAFNASYSGLTGLYWLWRNVDADVKGLVYYRRLLGSPDPASRRAEDPFDRVATGEELRSLVEESGVILANRRSYYIEIVCGRCSHTFDGAPFDVCRAVLSDMCSECVSTRDRLMRARPAHIYNMFAMRADLFDASCAWLFPVLEELVGCVGSSGMTSFEAR